MIVGIDVDDVCADLLGEWLRRYNAGTGDNLLPDDLDQWEISKTVAERAAVKRVNEIRNRIGAGPYNIFEILQESDLYDHILPIPGARGAVKEMRDRGHRVVFITSCVVGSMDQKVRWLQRYGFLDAGHRSPADLVIAADKSLINADVLIDDHVKNVESFPRKAILIDRPHNHTIPCRRLRLDSLSQVPGWLMTPELLD